MGRGRGFISDVGQGFGRGFGRGGGRGFWRDYPQSYHDQNRYRDFPSYDPIRSVYQEPDPEEETTHLNRVVESLGKELEAVRKRLTEIKNNKE